MDIEDALPYIAVLAVGYTIGSILLATAISPSFVWQENALSHLGVTTTDAGTTTTAILFNGGLVGGGLVGVMFASFLYRLLADTGRQVVVVLLGVTFFMSSLVGVFPTGTAPHFPVAITFYLFITLTLWTAGVVWFRDGDRRWAGVSVAAGTGNILVWVGWFTLAENPDAFAVPEILGAAIFSVWVCGAALSLSRTLKA